MEEPEDQPDRMQMCMRCGRDLPLTRENFLVFQSRGLFYWRRDCLQDKRDHSFSPGTLVRKMQVEETILSLTVDGVPPSGREVMRAMGLNDDRQLRNYWDQLAAEGRVIPRQKAAP
jgi:hypothetical protein